MYEREEKRTERKLQEPAGISMTTNQLMMKQRENPPERILGNSVWRSFKPGNNASACCQQPEWKTHKIHGELIKILRKILL